MPPGAPRDRAQSPSSTTRTLGGRCSFTSLHRPNRSSISHPCPSLVLPVSSHNHSIGPSKYQCILCCIVRIYIVYEYVHTNHTAQYARITDRVNSKLKHSKRPSRVLGSVTCESFSGRASKRVPQPALAAEPPNGKELVWIWRDDYHAVWLHRVLDGRTHPRRVGSMWSGEYRPDY